MKHIIMYFLSYSITAMALVVTLIPIIAILFLYLCSILHFYFILRKHPISALLGFIGSTWVFLLVVSVIIIYFLSLLPD